MIEPIESVKCQSVIIFQYLPLIGQTLPSSFFVNNWYEFHLFLQLFIAIMVGKWWTEKENLFLEKINYWTFTHPRFIHIKFCSHCIRTFACKSYNVDVKKFIISIDWLLYMYFAETVVDNKYIICLQTFHFNFKKKVWKYITLTLWKRVEILICHLVLPLILSLFSYSISSFWIGFE